MARRRRRRRSRRSYGGVNQRYRFTPARRAALRKAQLASARKRKRRRKVAAGVAIGSVTAGGIVARHKLSGSKFTKHVGVNASSVTGAKLGNAPRAYAGRRSASIAIPFSRSRKVSVGYQHKSLKVGGRKKKGSKAKSVLDAPTPVAGGQKTYGGKEIIPAHEWLQKETSGGGTADSIDIRQTSGDYKKVKGTYIFQPKQPRSKESLFGHSIDSYFNELNRVHGIGPTRKKKRKTAAKRRASRSRLETSHAAYMRKQRKYL